MHVHLFRRLDATTKMHKTNARARATYAIARAKPNNSDRKVDGKKKLDVMSFEMISKENQERYHKKQPNTGVYSIVAFL